MVQTAHAAAVVGCDANLIVLKAKNLENLVDIYQQLSIIDMSPVAFHEPDIGNEMTAFGLRVLPEDTKKLRHFPLLKEKDLCLEHIELKKDVVTNTGVVDHVKECGLSQANLLSVGLIEKNVD